ncbi:aminotransferase class I/II-fold pyridoxal phosphate-dependent enzyme [Candidatus Venteria ishoeyi]|uniref:Aminotransferase n=1 Tax=Candidatus Venteria ishoeyi TaxID=1899563 RepID=A0A1H6F487_9GAMM|nr:aminotransferase class I/II-fold pyridoxal phosphate-dependent enzyme [Candidatus Venteria ishoeyi]MDM8546199.1 aminotransferase class I/II-fold pyridoxal phosphate-dependent enzyme [Candidatus Venteria ishoeyi]SEH04383.1 Putative N-acetyl-LL-diaminopimelate aminotransferase [Candidatus Venteria ishoeyi]
MSRLKSVTPFLVMDILRKARSLKDVIHFEIGEPDVPPADAVKQALSQAALEGKVGYTESLGLWELRQAIADFYQRRYGVTVAAERIAITVGTSGAFLITYAILLSAGERLLLTDPAYPCYKNFAHLLDIKPVFAPIDASTDYQLTPQQIRDYPGIRAVQISSPSNPIGNVYPAASLKALIETCEAQGATFISDEIYHGLTYEEPAHTALEFSDQVIVINSFSKYFSLPGLRLGWAILPPNQVRNAEKVIQNLFIAAPTLSQYGALAAFDEAYLRQTTETYRQRRDYLYQALSELFEIETRPQGAFYIWANVEKYTDDSVLFAKQLLDEIRVATTPGLDFGQNQAHKYLRFAYTRDLAHLQEGVRRLQQFLR